jgi:hypothetical protein
LTSSRTACALRCAIGLASGCTDRSTPPGLFIATEWEGAYDFGPGAAGIAEPRDVLVIGAPF